MRVYSTPEEFEKKSFNVVTIGTFDGVHLGHQKILNRLRELAEENHGETVLITFWPHPRHVLYPDQHLPLINTFEEKAQLLEKYGVDHLIRIPFTPEFSQWSSQQFIRNILVDAVGTDLLVVGYNHRFGKNREGSFENLKKQEGAFGFMTEEISREEIDKIGVSSTNVRMALEKGDVINAHQLLGHPYSLSGTVDRGDQIGRKLGFPTANINFPSNHKLVPPDGVYAVKVDVMGLEKEGMLYIGSRPTLQDSKRVVEVNIFEFDADIYNLTIRVDFIGQIRGDMKFDSLEELSEQLKKDKKNSLLVLNTYAE